MQPSLQPGDLVLLCAPPREQPRRGEIVELLDPRDQRRLIKRVHRVETLSFAVRGDNSEASRDSRDFGELPLAAWQGLALFKVSLDPVRVRWIGPVGDQD